jgi:glycosyltransferase involved in cell wall biosynthesis
MEPQRSAPERDTAPAKGSVSYLCLQATRQGQASYAHVHEIIEGLRRQGWQVALTEPEYAEEGAELPGAMGRIREFRRIQRRFREDARDADVLYVRAHPFAISTARWARRQGIPIVQEVNGPYDDLFLAWPATRRFSRQFISMMRWQYRNADALITVTPELAEWLRAETGRDDVTVVPNAANTSVFRPEAPARPGLPERHVAFFGAFAPWQGIETMLRAVREPAWPDGVPLVFAGDGKMRAEVERAASNDPRVVYLGVLPYEEVPGILVGSIAGLSPKEAVATRAATGLSPLKLYEIASCGTALVVSDLPGLTEFVNRYDCGLAVPPEDSGALAEAVAKLASDTDGARAMGARGRQAVVSEHSWDARAADTSDVLANLAGPRATT